MRFLEEKKAEISLVKSGNQFALKVYKPGLIALSDYKIQSSASGETELCVTIKGKPNEFELKASLIQ